MRKLAMTAVSAIVLATAGIALTDEGDWRAAAQAEIDAFMEQHPKDFTGIDQLLAKYGLPPMKVSVDGVDGDLTGAEAEQILAARDKYSVPISALAVPAANADVPANAFGVWISVMRDLYNGRVVVGNWNFRDDFHGGHAPDDVAAIQANLAGGCWRIASNALSYRVSDYRGRVQNGLLYVIDGGINGSPILGVHDDVPTRVQFVDGRIPVDNGYFRANYVHTGRRGCASTDKFGAQFQYEHNEGGGGLSTSAGWGVFSVFYTAPATTLRRSSNVVWL